MMLVGVSGSIGMEMVSIVDHYAMKNMLMTMKVVKMIVKLANMEMKGMDDILKFFFYFHFIAFSGVCPERGGALRDAYIGYP